jgi:hypothetical protein
MACRRRLYYVCWNTVPTCEVIPISQRRSELGFLSVFDDTTSDANQTYELPLQHLSH